MNRRIVSENYYLKLLDVILISFVTAHGQFNVNVFTLLILAVIINAYFVKEYEKVTIFTILGMITYLELVFLNFKPFEIDIDTIATYFFYVFDFIICISVSNYLLKRIIEKKNEIIEYENKTDEMTLNTKELMNINTELKCQVNTLEQKRKKDSRSIAELSTIQEVSNVVNSTLDIKELFDLVNDVIIGLLGAAYCTIFLRTDGSEKITVKSSNITNEKYLDDLKEKVIPKMFDLVEDSHKSVANNIDPYSYPNGLDRGIESTLFVPIGNKGKTLGVILAEHTMQNWADDQTRKFVETVANQVGLAVENAMLYEEMERLAVTDALTRVNNRTYFQKNFNEEFEKAKGKYPLSLVMMDIDNFKRFNDKYGHDFGDEVLRSTAQVIKNSLNQNGTIYRFGGEEFVILFKHTSLEEAYKLANDIRIIVENNLIEYNNNSVNITISMGVSESPKITSTERELLKAADEALYKAKEDGRNCVRKANPPIRRQKTNQDEFMDA